MYLQNVEQTLKQPQHRRVNCCQQVRSQNDEVQQQHAVASDRLAYLRRAIGQHHVQKVTAVERRDGDQVEEKKRDVGENAEIKDQGQRKDRGQAAGGHV